MKLIVGRKPVLEALNNNVAIDQVQILFGQKGAIIDAIFAAAKKRGIKCTYVKAEKFNTLDTNEVNTQGIIAIQPVTKNYSVDEVIQKVKQTSNPLILILDSIQDPHNTGAILRTAECSGVTGVIITKFNSAPINETVLKTSAGSAAKLMIAYANNLATAIDQLKREGFWIYGSTLNNAQSIYDCKYDRPVALIVGNEEKGIRKLTADRCDYLIKIPMEGTTQSLNVSVATGILLFEIQHQRKLIK